ncbi:carboxypeptidase-like regulatory domain-containing protein [Hymenobacter negativus]|uniref:Carboxypeptidase-like regulatory domain-containing protein n=1 Tax=Hymenobacter negativus TaxID=2795026 RepID=A0ABS3QI41_9BACT|nr:carboxypeptidase-like regulatory domain-containing protein [Hymenobacter negativus]MBO2010390.1 carboxypeptidase-like regulatory domain-containing protein [Hymenobacter negativus]
MPRHASIHIPQPCHESWDAMTPNVSGRHCAACQKTVVDFTHKTDAEILAYLAKAAGGRTCGRFAAGQLERPLQRAASAAPTTRWRAWLAAAVAVWGVREGVSIEAKAQIPSEWRARYWGGPVPALPAAATTEAQQAPASSVSPAIDGQIIMGGLPVSNAHIPAHPEPLAHPTLVLRGVVADASTKELIPGVTIQLKGTTTRTSTNADGAFELAIPAQFEREAEFVVVVQTVGYVTQEKILTANAIGAAQRFVMPLQIMGQLALRPLPWHPREFYYWSKYWLTRPFHRK